MEQLTVSEINTIIEALDAWTTSSRTSSMLGGLIFGALLSRGEEGEGAEKGAEIVKKMTEGEEDKQKQREEIAILLKAKLIKLRDVVEAQEFASTLEK